MLNKILITILLALPCFAQSSKDRLAELQAQHDRDVATINRLIAERQAAGATTNNGAAIAKLSADNKTRDKKATQAADTHAQEAQQAVGEIKSAAQSVADSADAVSATAETTKLEVAKMRAAMPVNSVPVWLAAISGMVAVVVAVTGMVTALGTRKTVDTIHTLTNSTLSEMTNKLQVALEKISGLEKLVTNQAENATRQTILAEVASKPK